MPSEKGWVFALRVTTYILTSLASLLFIAMVIYGYVVLQSIGQSLQSNPLFGGSSYSSPAVPEVPSQADVCLTNPDAPECTEGNY